jgi:hypothetical protein
MFNNYRWTKNFTRNQVRLTLEFYFLLTHCYILLYVESLLYIKSLVQAINLCLLVCVCEHTTWG